MAPARPPTVEILEGFRRADAGEVRVLGTDPHRAGADWRARIGNRAPDHRRVPGTDRGRGGAPLRRYYPNADDPDTVIERVGLTAKRSARTEQLSGGQKRRLDVALGIVGHPELLFLDEPTAGFDPEARRGFWELIRGCRPPVRRSCSPRTT
jgi:ABC-2 type transport system ATP-binding protein